MSLPAAVGPARSEAELDDLIDAFEAGMVPRGEWTHRAHLSMALVYLLRYGDDLGPARIRSGILHHNAALNIEQTPTSGYHETITRFYIRVVQGFLRSAECHAGAARAGQRVVRTVRRPQFAAAVLLERADQLLGGQEPDGYHRIFDR